MADNSTDTTVPTPTVTGGSIGDKLAGKVKEVAGTVIGDDKLAVEGHLQSAKAAAADDAVDLAQTAQADEAKASLAAREQQLQAEQAALAAKNREDAQVRAVEAKAARDVAQVERDAAKREAAAERTRKQRESAADRELFAAASQRAEAEKQADALSAQARREAVRPLSPAAIEPTGVRALPGRVIEGYLGLLQRPFAVLAKSIGKDESWAPMVTLRSLRAGIERSAGTALHDTALRTAGERAADEVRRQRDAAGLEARAAATRAQANRALAAAKSETAASKQAAAKAAQKQEASIESDAAQGKRATASAKAAGKSQVAETAARNAKARELSDRDRSEATLRKEADALRAERAALGKQDEVVRLDAAVDLSKAERTRR